MSACLHCETQNDLNLNFCINCEQQINCLECGKGLIKAKSKCLYCGLSLAKSERKNAMNTFSLEENQSGDTYSKKVSFAFTNEGVDKVATVLAGQVPLQFNGNTKHQISSSNTLPIPPAGTITPEAFIEVKTETPNVNQDSEPINANKIDPKRIFDINSKGILISQWADYKGKTRKDQQVRFSLLYVWAHNLLCFEKPLSRAIILDGARENGVFDQNFAI